MGALSAQPNQSAFESGRSVAAGCRERVLFKLQAQRGASARRGQIPSQIDLCHGRSRSRNLHVLLVLCMKLGCGMPCNKIFNNVSRQSKYDIVEFVNSVIQYGYKMISYKYTKNKIEPKLPDYTMAEIKDLAS